MNNFAFPPGAIPALAPVTTEARADSGSVWRARRAAVESFHDLADDVASPLDAALAPPEPLSGLKERIPPPTPGDRVLRKVEQ